MISVPQQTAAQAQRCRLLVRGQVQGVGFRPCVYRLAVELGLRGWVRNCAQGVEIELQGQAGALHDFIARLPKAAPPQARISAVEQSRIAPLAATPPFFIAASATDAVRTTIAADAALCADCLAELFDPGDRRYRYPFINCVHCGPRFTLSRALPFDRLNTSMAPFEQCPRCLGEYLDPAARRFHAQANACPDCGPRLRYHDGAGEVMPTADVIAAALSALLAGRIIALKSLGGFQLLCDARNAEAVARLRARKGREAKPFAVLAANSASFSPWVRCGVEQEALLESAAHPIVVLEKTAACDSALAGVAPGLAHLGVMLPYTPLHYLLFHEAAGRPAGTAWLRQPQALILVCTSANRSGEPLLTDNREACEALHGIADGFVSHDRAITQPCDDSVMHGGGAAPRFIRRARGFVPQPIRLPRSGPALLALGGDLKNSFCITRGDEAYVSQHNGDLSNGRAWRGLARTLERWLITLDIAPQYVVHDRHPDFYSCRLARAYAAARDLPCIAVQHHHAHIAAVLAEHGLHQPVLGLALDGFGMGDDGGLWGGELLRVDGADCRRVAHLRELALPGGDRAAREPWRMAASALHSLGRGGEIQRRYASPAAATVSEMLDKRVNAPLTSAAGRWFDAAAGLLGIAARNSYEGQAAMQLEALALRYGRVAASRADFHLEASGVLNLLPLLERLARVSDPAYGAALFHATLAAALAEWLCWAARRESLAAVVLNGGCFMNGVLCRELSSALRTAGLQVYLAQRLPPNDGGLSLGQAWVGLASLGRAAPA